MHQPVPQDTHPQLGPGCPGRSCQQSPCSLVPLVSHPETLRVPFSSYFRKAAGGTAQPTVLSSGSCSILVETRGCCGAPEPLHTQSSRWGECLRAGKGEQESEKQIWFHSVISHFALQLPQRGAWAGSCLCCASRRGSGRAGTSPVLTTSMRPSSRCPSFLPSSP